MRLLGHIACMGRMSNEYESLISKAQGKNICKTYTKIILKGIKT
jgi:hypothetical protein